MKNFKLLFLGLAVSLFTISGCKDLIEKEELRISPNAPGPNQIDPDYLLNNIQLSLPGWFSTVQTTGAALTRQRNMFGDQYANAYTPESFSGIWSTAYAGIMVDVNTLVPIAIERRLFTHAAMALIIKAYVFSTMADMFGDIPYAEAARGTEGASFFNPELSTAQEIYTAALADLNQAAALLDSFQLTSPVNDLYFPGPATTATAAAPLSARDFAWKKLAYTLQLKMAVLSGNNTLRDAILAKGRDSLLTVSAATAASATASLATRNNVSFKFQYGTNTANPDTRHPNFTSNYLNGATQYMSNAFMNYLYNDKVVVDPRIRYYFYRQTLSRTTNVNELDCINVPVPPHIEAYYANAANNPWGIPTVWCHLTDGYWGRDHGNADGIPPDNFLRTIFGVYPAGGAFDNNSVATRVSASSGLQGAGIAPIWMHFFTDFLWAQAELARGNDAAAKTAFELGVRGSINYVRVFGAAAAGTSTLIPATSVTDDYWTEVSGRWDAADAAGKLHLLMREYFIALWGNGIEAYNNYRKTTYPRDLQPHEFPNQAAGSFFRSFLYPATYRQLNANYPGDKPANARVFWDTNTTFNFDY